MNSVLIYNKKLSRFEMTRFDAYKRYRHTIEPIEKLLEYIEFGTDEKEWLED